MIPCILGHGKDVSEGPPASMFMKSVGSLKTVICLPATLRYITDSLALIQAEFVQTEFGLHLLPSASSSSLPSSSLYS